MDTTAIPHPPHRLPVLGDVLGVNPRAPVQSALRLVRDLGPISVRKLLNIEVVTVGGAELAAELNDETRFSKHVGLHLLPLRAIVGDALFTAENDEPNWQLAHDILVPAFTREAMRGYHSIMFEVVRELLARWDGAAECGRQVDVTADMTRLTLETIGCAGFGYRFGSFERDQPHPFVTAMMRTLRYAPLSTFQALAPVRRVVVGSARQHRGDLATMQRIVDEVIAARRDDKEEPDLLGLMLRSAHPETGRRLDEVNIRQQVITFMIAGHETTSGALSFALYYLIRDPQALARAQAEVDALWGQASDPEPAFTDIPKLRYVRAALDEALRLWPTAPAYLRAARTDTVLGGRYRMNRGDWAMVLLPLLHRDPSVWHDPDRFDPDRFAPGQAKARPAHAYKPFGTGQRACIGRQFALHEAVLALGLLLHRYDLSTPDDYRLQITESLTLKPRGFYLVPRRRHRR
ncbi:cytochrome P450 [Mycobacterium sp. 852002-51057_SCH5723018]|uniref:cytochrome P450 n=1 Tax=Mycobacterium sp. 852002-51057_SCH5723018 TaxID=1834094 RepID=UPI0007FCA87D|nr:cytochrome P450 [Mycobacterium sp. 852002-51057_SCH5723018]OBG29682.1 cytochrome P450 [Mycobacterium sp. 852002-51057_SCH5723018]